jgi:hypothetical protein
MMRHDVIGDGRRRHDAALQTELAERLGFELQPAQALSARCFVEVSPGNRIAANSRHRVLCLNVELPRRSRRRGYARL